MHRIVVYLDVFFIVNFLMDMLILTAHKRIFRYTTTHLKVTLAATLGALWACAEELLALRDTIIGVIGTYILIAMIMVKISVINCSLKKLINLTAGLYIVAAVVGGLCHIIFYYSSIGYFINVAVASNKYLLTGVFFSIIAIVLIDNYVNCKVKYEQHIYKVILEIKDQRINLKAFYDTGNTLRDTYTNEPISIIEKETLKAVIDDYKTDYDLKYHLIAYSSVGCENGLIGVIRATGMYIYVNGNVKYIDKPLLGLSNQHLSNKGEYEMLINGASFELEREG